jgi:hypothetical protein
MAGRSNVKIVLPDNREREVKEKGYLLNRHQSPTLKADRPSSIDRLLIGTFWRAALLG